jgi:hypothetical protein
VNLPRTITNPNAASGFPRVFHSLWRTKPGDAQSALAAPLHRKRLRRKSVRRKRT